MYYGVCVCAQSLSYVQLFCDSMDRGAWQATVHGVIKSLTHLRMHEGQIPIIFWL